jgi:hypothetical protein
MTEQPAGPHLSNPNPRRSTFYEFLVISILLVAVGVVFALIYLQGLVPAFLLPAAPTGTAPADTALPESTSSGYLALVETLTAASSAKTQSFEAPVAATPLTDTLPDDMPAPTEPLARTPVPPTSSVPSLTPAFGSCQYTLKSGAEDFLYAIYWNWHIDDNIPRLQDYYAKIACAAVLTNMKCSYQSARPNITQPGWILDLPGVSASTCSSHGGTPVP